MDPGQPTTMTESQALIGMVRYYRYIYPRGYHVLLFLTEVAIVPKVRAILWNNNKEMEFCDLKLMSSSETILSYPDWKTIFTLHTDESDKQFSDDVSQNNKPISFFSIKLIMPSCDYTTKKKDIIFVVECLKQFHVLIFIYEIYVFCTTTF